MIITKLGCKVAEPGSVMFNFAKQGKLVVKGSSEDAVFEAAMEVRRAAGTVSWAAGTRAHGWLQQHLV